MSKTKPNPRKRKAKDKTNNSGAMTAQQARYLALHAHWGGPAPFCWAVAPGLSC